MDRSSEKQLLELLAQPVGRIAMRQQSEVERLVAGILGGQRYDLQGATRGPDIMVPRVNGDDIAVEIKLLWEPSISKNLSNRVSDLLASAVEARRTFRNAVTLTAVLLVHSQDNSASDHDHHQRLSEAVRRLLRSDDGVGFDSIMIGFATNRLLWRYITANPPSDPGSSGLGRRYSTEEAVRLFTGQPSPAPMRPVDNVANRPLRALLVADEWQSGRGGISTVNRELAIALASAGIDTAVLLPHVSDADSAAAADVDVTLVAPARIPGLETRELLLLRGVFADQSWTPDFIVGHGRLLGPYAAVQQQEHFPRAQRVHFVHTDAEQLEAAKESPGGDSNMTTADKRRGTERDLARSADLVVGIGPHLTAMIRDELIGPGPATRVIPIVPGLRSTQDIAVASAPVTNRILIVGRADDFRSKGIDIAAEALLRIVDSWPQSRPHPPALVLRGVPDDSANAVKALLDEILEGRVTYHLRPYSDSEENVTKDLTQARVVLMPSRHEGFGLAAYEAIASGTPVLISAQSGLAQFLVESDIDTFPSSIVSTRDTLTRNAIDQWADAIQQILDAPDIARVQAKLLRQSVAKVASWKAAVAQLLAELEAL